MYKMPMLARSEELVYRRFEADTAQAKSCKRRLAVVRNLILVAVTVPFLLANTALAGIAADSDVEGSPIPTIESAKENETAPDPISVTEGVRAASVSDIEKSIAHCIEFIGDLDRLECFDQLARALVLDRPQDHR